MVIVLLAAWLIVWPVVNGLISPNADLGDLNSTRPQITLRASQLLKGESEMKTVDRESSWTLVYILPRGAAMYDGSRAPQRCVVTFRVDKNQPSAPQLDWEQVGSKSCH